MCKKIGVCVLAVILIMGLMTGCMEWENTASSDPVQTPPMEETGPTGTPEEQPQETLPPEQTEPPVTPTPSPSPSPSPQPLDPPTIIGQHLGSVPSLIMVEEKTEGSVSPDEVFAIALEENMSTGYLWDWDWLGEIDCILDTHWEPEEPVAGVPGLHLWAFQISEPGEYTLDFTLVAPEGGAQDVRSFTVTVE